MAGGPSPTPERETHAPDQPDCAVGSARASSQTAAGGGQRRPLLEPVVRRQATRPTLCTCKPIGVHQAAHMRTKITSSPCSSHAARRVRAAAFRACSGRCPHRRPHRPRPRCCSGAAGLQGQGPPWLCDPGTAAAVHPAAAGGGAAPAARCAERRPCAAAAAPPLAPWTRCGPIAALLAPWRSVTRRPAPRKRAIEPPAAPVVTPLQRPGPGNRQLSRPDAATPGPVFHCQGHHLQHLLRDRWRREERRARSNKHSKARRCAPAPPARNFLIWQPR